MRTTMSPSSFSGAALRTPICGIGGIEHRCSDAIPPGCAAAWRNVQPGDARRSWRPRGDSTGGTVAGGTICLGLGGVGFRLGLGNLEWWFSVFVGGNGGREFCGMVRWDDSESES